jgi:hypothetical protein
MTDAEFERAFAARVATIDAKLDAVLEGLRAALAYTRESQRRLRQPLRPAPLKATNSPTRRRRAELALELAAAERGESI